MRRTLSLGVLGLSLGLAACSSDSLVGPETAPVRAEEGITDPSRVWRPYSETPTDDGRVWRPYGNVEGEGCEPAEAAGTEDDGRVWRPYGTAEGGEEPTDDGRVWRPYGTVEGGCRVWRPY